MTSGNRTETRDLYAYSGLTGMLGKKVSYNATLGVNNDIFTTVSGDSYSFTYLRPLSPPADELVVRLSSLTIKANPSKRSSLRPDFRSLRQAQ